MKVCPSCHTAHSGQAPECIGCKADLSKERSRKGHQLRGAIIDGKYALDELLGEGGMAWVYQAKHTQLDRSVVMKLLKSTGATPVFTRSFENEVRALAGLNHPHIVAVLDSGKSAGGFFYFVTEFIPGATLHDLLYRKDEMPLSRAIGIMHQVMAGVEEAHAMNVIHRDIKPANILVSRLRSGEDFIKVFDFGIAVLQGERPPIDGEATFSGTVGFVAPECINGAEATETSDVYALGVVFYELLTGQEPFGTRDTGRLLAHQLKGEHIPLSQSLGQIGIPQGIEALVDKALSPDPAFRYRSVVELREALIQATRSSSRLALRCDKCTRPRDPLTGICDLHRPRQQFATPLSPSLPKGGLESKETIRFTPEIELLEREDEWDNLLELVASKGGAPHAEVKERCAEFLLGDDRVLEVVGANGAERSNLAEGICEAAKSLGLRTITTGRLPSIPYAPWGQARKILAGVLDLDLGDLTSQKLRDALDGLGAESELEELVCKLFGLGRAKPDSPGGAVSERRIVSASVATMTLAAPRKGTDVVFLAELNKCDFASRDFIRALVSDGSPWTGKIVYVGATPFFSTTPRRGEIRLETTEKKDGSLDGLTSLPAEAVDAFYIVATIGTDVDPNFLKSLVDADQVYFAIELLIRGGFLARAPFRKVAVANPRAANELTYALTDGLRRSLSNRIFEAMEARGESVFEVGEFAEKAGRFEDAFTRFERAGDEAVAWFDPESAALVHYRRAIHVAKWRLLIPDNDRRLLSLLVKQATALSISGHLRAAEMIYKEVLLNSLDHPLITRQANAGLKAIARS